MAYADAATTPDGTPVMSVVDGAPPRTKTVGVLGGMGPEATVAFLGQLLAATPAARDQDHLHVIVDSNPAVPDRNRAVAGTGPSPAPVLAEMARRLEAAGAELLVMPCNAAHAFADAVLGAVDVPFLSILDATVDATRRHRGITRVGVLAAQGALQAHLYRDAFGGWGIRTVEPEGASRDRFMELLYRIKRGDKGAEVRDAMSALAGDLIARGAEAIVAGCTEVPLVLAADRVPVPLVDSLHALAVATVEAARGVRADPGASGDGEPRGGEAGGGEALDGGSAEADALRPNP